MDDQISTALGDSRLIARRGLERVRADLACERRVVIHGLWNELEAGHAGLDAGPPEGLDRLSAIERRDRWEEEPSIRGVGLGRGCGIASFERSDERSARAVKPFLGRRSDNLVVHPR